MSPVEISATPELCQCPRCVHAAELLRDQRPGRIAPLPPGFQLTALDAELRMKSDETRAWVENASRPLFTSAMSFTDAGTFALLTAVVLSAILIIGTCERDSDVRSTSCAIRWRHAVTVQDSLVVAGHCGSDGLVRSGAKP